MEFLPLGTTGLRVSRLAFGAGPVPAVMTGGDTARQRALVRHLLDVGINWLDTAAGYGDGRAERAVGTALADLGAQTQFHVATKVRLHVHQLDDIAIAIRDSVAASLERLQLPQVTLLQLHNSITEERGDEPDSVSRRDVLERGGILDVLEQIRNDGLTRFIGITAIGQARALGEVIDAGRCDTIQIPYSLVNPSAGRDVPASFGEANYGNAIGRAATQRMGVFAIRVYAGGALTGQPPSPHTRTTRYFPLALFERDQARAARLRELAGGSLDVKELAVRFALSHPHVTSLIIGFAEPGQVDEAVRFLEAGPLPKDMQAKLRPLGYL